MHLTTMGYLSAATRVIEVDGTRASVIAGWGPDSTIWLTDVAHERTGMRRQWRRLRTIDSWVVEQAERPA